MEFHKYRRTGLSEMRPYVLGEDLTGISVSPEDSPRTDLGMIARNPKNHKDQWYVARKYFQDNLELVQEGPDHGVNRLNAINRLIQEQFTDTSDISDGYHTFGELYEFRKMYNAALFNQWGRLREDGSKREYQIEIPKYSVHKSWKHHDGELCFGGGWFIVSAMLPTGQISNHYKAEDWDLFKVHEVENSLFEFDGHTGADVLERLKSL